MNEIREARDSLGEILWYDTPHGAWHGSGDLRHLHRYAAVTGDRRAALVLEHRLAHQRWWVRLWWRLTHRRLATAPKETP